MQSVEVHPLTEDPTKAWNILRRNQIYLKVKTKLPTKEPSDNRVRFVCMSDTHSLIHDISFDLPDGDVFIHAGNFTKGGDIEEVRNFNAWLGKFLCRFIYLNVKTTLNLIRINNSRNCNLIFVFLVFFL